jgi:hypothetical protein
VIEASNESEENTLEQGHEVHTVMSIGTFDENESKRRPISFTRENLFIKV